MASTERPEARSLGDRVYDALFHNYVWQSIFRSGYPNTPRNQMLVVATNVFLHLHPTRIHRTHVKITHTYCLGGLSFFLFLGLMWVIRHVVVEEEAPAAGAAAS